MGNDIGVVLQIPGLIPGLTWIMEFCSIYSMVGRSRRWVRSSVHES